MSEIGIVNSPSKATFSPPCVWHCQYVYDTYRDTGPARVTAVYMCWQYYGKCISNITSTRYERIDTKVLFGGIVLGYCEVDVLEVWLQQTQLAGTCDSFGAPLNL